MRTPFYFFILLGISLQYLQAQTSDINKGCIPLNVNFTAPQLSDYYWDFNDGNNASISNANHIFTFDTQLLLHAFSHLRKYLKNRCLYLSCRKPGQL